MLGFDIETTGLLDDFPVATISVLCTVDSQTGTERVYNFLLAKNVDSKKKLKEDILEAFKRAEVLCAYNAVFFDIPFLRKQMDLADEDVQEWFLKLCDPFHSMRTAFQHTCKLNKMLALNGLDCKSASGLEAIEMAKNEDWSALEKYCLDDVRLTVQLCLLDKVCLFQHMDGFWVYGNFTKPNGPLFWAEPNTHVTTESVARYLGEACSADTTIFEELADFCDVVCLS